jgi:hypothetical protein
VHTLLDSSTLLLTAQQSPVNLATLITVLCDHLFDLLSIPSFPHPPPTPRGAEQRDLVREALNCLRVLSRVVPFVLGPQSTEPGELEEAIFWRIERTRVERRESTSAEAGRSSTEAPKEEEEEGQFVIDDEDDEDDSANATPTAAAGPSQPKEEWEEIPPLAERLLAALVDLAFVPGFTVAEECRTQDSAVAYVIW